MFDRLKTICALMALVGASVVPCLAADCCVPIYSQCNLTAQYTLGWKKAWWSEKVEKTNSFVDVMRGAAWRTDVAGEKLLITAAHNLFLKNFGKDQIHKLVKRNWPDNNWVELHGFSHTTTVHVHGGLSRSPKQIALPNLGGGRLELDVAVLYLADNDVFSSINPTPLANKLPEAGESIQIVGFPGTVKQQIAVDLTVSSVEEQSGYFLLNKPVDKGFSGGVVRDKDGKVAYGVIAGNTSDDKQTKVYLVSERLLSSAKPKPVEEVLKHEEACEK
jgi:hypothetical protein